jgi:hypothetical protein
MPPTMRGPSGRFVSGGDVIVVDATSLERVARNIDATAKLIGAELRVRTAALGESLVDDLSAAAPVGERQDPRWREHLAESFYTRPVGNSVQVLTSQGNKYSWTNYGAPPPGSSDRDPGRIYPRLKKALFWPGLGHPIAFVGPPITKLNPGSGPGTKWAEPIISEAFYTATGMPEASHTVPDVAQGTADAWVRDFTRMNKAARMGSLGMY